MPKWVVEVVIDLALVVGVAVAGGWLLYGLLRQFARHTSTARFWKSLGVAVFVGAVSANSIGGQWHLPLWCGAWVACLSAFLALLFVCSVTMKQAAGVAIAFLILQEGMQYGVGMLADRLLPGRRTFAQQYLSAEREARRAFDPHVRLFRGRDLLAQLVDALAKLTTPGEAERIQTDVSVGLGEIRARRLAATNREEVAANRRAYAALQQELLGRPGSTGTVTAAEIREALAML